VSVRVTFLGTGNAFADGGRSHACIYVRARDSSLLLDCGGSALPALKRHADLERVDGIVVSHLHGDHFGGIPYVLMDQHFAGRARPLTIVGPRELEERLRAVCVGLYADFFGRTRLGFPVRYVTFGGKNTELAGGSLSAHPVLHVPESDPHGVRLRVDGKLIAYSGDARWSESLPTLARGADLFICEATNFSRDDPSHISYVTLMSHRSELDSRRIVLTHLGAETLARLDEVEMEHAEEMLELEV
jgi:ribonuclease BN (tRNA processing enzyme)